MLETNDCSIPVISYQYSPRLHTSQSGPPRGQLKIIPTAEERLVHQEKIPSNLLPYSSLLLLSCIYPLKSPPGRAIEKLRTSRSPVIQSKSNGLAWLLKFFRSVLGRNSAEFNKDTARMSTSTFPHVKGQHVSNAKELPSFLQQSKAGMPSPSPSSIHPLDIRPSPPHPLHRPGMGAAAPSRDRSPAGRSLAEIRSPLRRRDLRAQPLQQHQPVCRQPRAAECPRGRQRLHQRLDHRPAHRRGDREALHRHPGPRPPSTSPSV